VPTPEQIARENIDLHLAQSGWLVQDYKQLNLSAGSGVAVREFPLKSGFADYLLYVDGKGIGTLEAKPEGHSLTGVEVQSSKYVLGLPEHIPAYGCPLPFAYESNGTETQFTSGLDPEPRSREVFAFHRPEELKRLALAEGQLRGNILALPELVTDGLWPAQITAVRNLDDSLKHNRPRALIQMATGSGKTFTACTFCYRLAKFAKAKRILFLVDRNVLGKQAMNEFQQYVSPYTQYTFTEEFPVQRLQKNTVDPTSKVVITTIQRLYSILKGEEEFAEENEEASLFEVASALAPREPVPVVYNPRIPIETFDFIVIDECHRSIYNIWRQVLDYFDAFLIGLTATPTKQTVGFFKNNLVQDYSHEKAVADGVNVGYEVYRIRTKVSEGGATLEGEPGLYIPVRDRRTREKRLQELDDDLTYTANQLDRDAVAQDQLRLVIRTFRDKLPEIFPGRTEVPKTLVFAKTDLHADDVVKVFREEFGKGNDFCQKITSKTTGKKPEDLLAEFRNSYNPRIAVTVDMLATGTDVRPLECLFFLRNVVSASYFEQMKGRGSRIVSSDDLQSVTPDARDKTHFVIVDAVGVCEQDKTESRPLDRKPFVPLDKILAVVAAGAVDADLVSTLAARLARLEQEIDAEQAQRIRTAAGGKDLAALAGNLLRSIDPDTVEERARAQFEIADEEEPTSEQLAQAEHAAMTQALKPFYEPKLREAILAARRSLDQVIDEITKDELLEAGFSAQAKEKARNLVDDFRAFVGEHRDEIEAIQILYSRPYRAGLRYGQVKELAAELRSHLRLPEHPESPLWTAYEQVEPDKVKGQGGKALVDLVALVRHALDPESLLVPVKAKVEERYRDWLREQEGLGLKYSKEQRVWLDAIKDHIAMSLAITPDDFADVPFAQMGGLGRVYEVFGDYLEPLLDELNERLAA